MPLALFPLIVVFVRMRAPSLRIAPPLTAWFPLRVTLLSVKVPLFWIAPPSPPEPLPPLRVRLKTEAVLPGLTVNTTRIGYYGFLCWAIDLVNAQQPSAAVSRREMLNRLERALVLCEFVHHGSEDGGCRVVGQRSRMQVLQGSENNRYRLPNRIVKNQNSAGALRLYATSLVNMGFAEEAPELAVDGKLPWVLTDLGRSLRHAFARRLPEGFEEFAFSDGAILRERVGSWGRALCLSKLRTHRSYREVFLAGFLRGNSEGAEARFSTVKRLFKRRLLDGAYRRTARSKGRDAVAEDDVDFAEDVDELEGLTNYEVLLDSYEQKAVAENADFQEAAVYEFIALGLSALFHHAVRRLQDSGQKRIGDLQGELAKDRLYSKTWARPRREAASKARPCAGHRR